VWGFFYERGTPAGYGPERLHPGALLDEAPDAALGKEAEVWYRGTSLIRNCPTLESHSRSMPRAL